MTSPAHTRHDSMGALQVGASDSETIRCLIARLEQMETSVERKLGTIRQDVDTLLRGGWEVKIGPFQVLAESDQVGTPATQQRISSGEIEDQKSVGNGFNDDQGEHNEPARDARQTEDGQSAANGGAAINISESEHLTKHHGEPKAVREKVKAAPRRKSPLPSIFPSPDEALPSVEDPAIAASSAYVPLIIRQSSPLMSEIASGIPNPAATRTFSVKFIHNLLEGIQWSPGYYFKSRGSCILSTRSYYGLDATTDPFLPPAPGAHWAKLVPFIRNSIEDDDPDDQNTLDVPVFIKASAFATMAGKSSDEYIYFGNYSQLRYSDRLDYERMMEVVPHSVKMHWAEQVADVGRPAWVTEALMNHFEQKPQFDGHVDEYDKELERWEQEIGETVRGLTKEDLLKAFDSADCADPPGLRLWWEYLHCVGYDDSFYRMLVKKQDALKHKH